MPIVHQFDTNKKRRTLCLNNGAEVDILVKSMFEVELQQGDAAVGRLRFSALSSLNNLEMKPHYLLYEAAVTAEFLLADARQLLLAALQFFREYTNGRFRIADAVDAEHGLSALLG